MSGHDGEVCNMPGHGGGSILCKCVICQGTVGGVSFASV